MLAYPIATAFLFILGEGAEAAATPNQKMDFMRAMKESTTNASRSRKLSASHKSFKDALLGNSKKFSPLRKDLIKKSTAVVPLGERKLQNNNDAEYVADEAQDTNANQAYKKDTDDYFAAYGEWDNGFGFDVAQYSLSYHSCATVRQYDNALATEGGTNSVFTTNHFAIFRFCPATTCMGGSESLQFYDEWEGQWEEWEEESAQQQEGYDQWFYEEQWKGQKEDESTQQEDPDCVEYNDEGGCEEFNYQGKEEQAQDPDCLSYNDDGVCEEFNHFGARGDGCQDNYGEYMIKLQDYLELMLGWQEERFGTYCEYCAVCMYQVYEAWIEEGGDNRKLSYEEFKNSDEVARKLSIYAQDYFYEVCPEFDTCTAYKYTCNQEIDDHLTEYFECTKVERNGNVAYVGPHCAGDKITVTLGIYADEYCNEYIGNGVNVAKFIGEDIDNEEDSLKSYYNSMNGQLDQLEYSNGDDVCIPCRKRDLPYDMSVYEASDDDLEETQTNTDEEEINEICENLYQVSAHCDKYFRSYTNKARQAQNAEAIAEERMVCDFIASVALGNYDEPGSTDSGNGTGLESQPGWLNGNIYAQKYGQNAAGVTPLQTFFLVASAAASVAMAAWAVKLHQKMSRGGAGLLQDSGFVRGRSQSDTTIFIA